MRTGKWRVRALAWGCVLGWHAVVGWVLWHAVRPPARDAGDAGLVLVFLPPPPPAEARVPVVRSQPRARRTRSSAGARPAVAGADAAPALAPAPTPQAPALSLVVVEQARDIATVMAQASPPPAPDPFHRPAALPANGTARFAMRRSITAADVVGKIGQLIGGPGYDPDPCPRNRENLHNLLAAGDSPRLRMALQFDAEHCRP